MDAQPVFGCGVSHVLRAIVMFVSTSVQSSSVYSVNEREVGVATAVEVLEEAATGAEKGTVVVGAVVGSSMQLPLLSQMYPLGHPGVKQPPDGTMIDGDDDAADVVVTSVVVGVADTGAEKGTVVVADVLFGGAHVPSG